MRSPWRAPIGRIVCALALGLAAAAGAHELGAVQATARFHRDDTFTIDIRAHGAAAHRLAARADGLVDARFDGRPADLQRSPPAPSHAGALDPAAGIALTLAGPVPRGAQLFVWSLAADLGPSTISFRSDDQPVALEQWLAPGEPSRAYPLTVAVTPPTRLEVVGRYLGLGFLHILPHGTDHVLFVLGIFLLAGRLRPVLAQVTAFTAAHTLTLGLSLYGLVALPERIVEPLIALSIVWVAVENVLVERVRPRRLLLVFAFGLLHGLGFAGVLRSLGLPRADFLLGLVSFNCGVEAGQLSTLAAAFLLLGLPLGRRTWYRGRIVVPASCLIALTGLVWSLERVLS